MPTRKNAAYDTEVFSKEYKGYLPHGGDEHKLHRRAGKPSPIVHLIGGNLYVNNQIVPDAKWDRNNVSWHHATSSTDVNSGLLNFSPDRTWFTGHITQGSLHDSSKRAISEVRGAVAPSVYNCEVSFRGFDTAEEATDAAMDDSTAFHLDDVPTITYGVKFDETGVPRFLFQVAGYDWTQDTTQTLDKEYNNVISLIYNSDAVSFLATQSSPPYPLTPAEGQFTMHWDGKYLWGYTKIYDKETFGPSEKYYAFRGTLQEAVLRASYTAELKHTPYTAMAVAASAPLSVDELRGLTSSDVVLQDRVNELMVIAMKYCCPSKWLKDIFGEARPDISLLPYMEAAVKTEGGRQFYGTSFFNPYLGSGLDQLRGKGAPKRHMTSQEKLKVQYFLSEGLAKDPNYNIQNQYAFMQAYVDTQPRIKAYLDDQASNGANKFYWADNLYASINNDAVINQLSNQIVVNSDFTLLKRYTLLLQVLGREEYASEFASVVAANALTKSANNESAEAIIVALPDVIQQFITQFSTDPGADAPKEEVARYEEAKALQAAADVSDGVFSLATAFSALFAANRNTGDSIATTVNRCMPEFAEAHPQLMNSMSALGTAFFAVCWGAAVYALVIGYTNWDTINEAQKTALIGFTVQFAGEFALMVPSIGRIVIKSGVAVWEAAELLLPAVRAASNFVGSLRAAKMAGEFFTFAWKAVGGPRFVNWVTSMSEWLAENVFKRAGSIIDAAGTRLASLYTWAKPYLEKFLRALGPLVAAAAAAAAIYTYIEDVRHGADKQTQSLDLALAIISTLEFFVTFAAAIWVGSVALLAIGVILALAALVIILVQLFTPPKPPPSPLEKFMKNDFYPWLKKQDEPPQGWTPPTAPSA